MLHFRGANQRFRRHASDVDTGATERAAFDERDARTELRGANRGGEPGRPATEHDNVGCAAGGHVRGAFRRRRLGLR